MRLRLFAAGICLAMGTAVLSAATMKQIRLTEGREAANTISAPVYDNSGMPSVETPLQSWILTHG